jgi:hypothetical protein
MVSSPRPGTGDRQVAEAYRFDVLPCGVFCAVVDLLCEISLRQNAADQRANFPEPPIHPSKNAARRAVNLPPGLL